MAYALVGTIGTATVASSNITPAYGQTPTASNLLICFIAGVGGANATPSTPSGWSLAVTQIGTTAGQATIFYKVAAGGDAAPNIISGNSIVGQLAEFSGNATSSPLDKTGINKGSSSPITATFGAADTASAELIVMCGCDFRSAARTPSDTWTSNHATITQAGNNNGVSTTGHYSFGYSLATTSNSGADTAVMTLSVTTSLTELTICAATFLLAAVVPNVLPELIKQPMTPSGRVWRR